MGKRRRRHLRDLQEALRADPHGDGVMVTLWMPTDVADQLAIDGGQPAEILHCTLAYLGQDVPEQTLAAARRIVAEHAARTAPLEGTVGGLGRFANDPDALYAPLDVAGLGAFRTHLVEDLIAAGVPVATDHDFTPHCTLAYLDPGDDLPVQRIDPQPVTFAAVDLAVGLERDPHPFTGGDMFPAAFPTYRKLNDALDAAITDLYGGRDRYVWVRDFDGATVTYERGGSNTPSEYDGTWRQSWAIADDAIVITGEPTKVEEIFVPVAEGAELEGDTVELVEADLLERALRDDGTVPIKVIEPGWGSSGYYSPEVLERDLADAFPTGTHMYWNHPTATEAAERPERSLHDLAAVTVSPVRWSESGPAGPGGYADAKVFGDWQPIVEELAPHIGVSIRAAGSKTWGEADGVQGEIVERIEAGRSIDFVTRAGAGGQVLELFESAPERITTRPPGRNPKEGQHMATLQETQADLAAKEKELEEAQAALAETEAEKTKLEEAAAERDAREAEAKLVTEARTAAAKVLEQSPLAEKARERVLDAVTVPRDIPLTEAGALDIDKLTEATKASEKAEVDYLAEATGRKPVTGLGGGSTGLSESEGDLEEADARRVAFFRGQGLSEEAAKRAAAGR